MVITCCKIICTSHLLFQAFSLVGLDGKNGHKLKLFQTGILVYIKADKKLSQLIKIKNDYLDKKDKDQLNSKDKKDYKKFLKSYEIYKKKYNQKNHQNVNDIRNVIKKHQSTAKIHLGGIPMIADDMMTYIKNDIIVFGAGVFLFIVCTLWFVFRSLLWVLIPLASCFFFRFNNGRIAWFIRVESYSYFIKLHCINVDFNNGNEYSHEHKIFTN